MKRIAKAEDDVAISPERLSGPDAPITIIRQHNRPNISRSDTVVSVVLVDQAVLMHMAVRALLAAHSRYSIIAAADSVVVAEQLVSRVRPGLLICETDIGGESGLDLCRWARRASPATRVVILTGRDEPLLARSAVAAGASGYLLKDTAPAVLTACLDRAAAGSVVIDERLGASREPARPIDPADEVGFSRREREVVAELVAGLDNRLIADRLCIAEETVKSHVKAIFRKLGARDRAHALALVLGTAVPTISPVKASMASARTWAGR
jgi:DNA-binding NarL/FixJ family response regulator